MFAVIKTGGKQYKVAKDDRFTVEKLAAEAGERVQFNEVLMLGGEGDVAVGAPFLEGAAVQAEVLEQTRGPKVISFKKRRRKHGSQRKRGHRQHLTMVQVTEILAKGGEATGVKAAIGAGSTGAVAATAPAAKPAKSAKPKAATKPEVAALTPTAETPAGARPGNLLDAAPEQADDLKKLTGVGPKMAEAMNTAGVYSFAQMTAWSEAEAAYMDEAIGAKGKLAGWIEQATQLAAEEK